MNSSMTESPTSPQVSGALRYERVARLEAVLSLRDQKSRSRVKIYTSLALLGLAVVAMASF